MVVEIEYVGSNMWGQMKLTASNSTCVYTIGIPLSIEKLGD